MILFKNDDGETILSISWPIASVGLEDGENDGIVECSIIMGTYSELFICVSGTTSKVSEVFESHNAEPGNEFLLVIEDPM